MDNFKKDIIQYLSNGEHEVAFNKICELIEKHPSLSNYSFAVSTFEKLDLNDLKLHNARIAILSSFIMEPILPCLKAKCYQSKITPAIYVAGYNQYRQEVLNPESGLYLFKPDVVILAVRLQCLAPKLWDSFLELNDDGIQNEVNVALDVMKNLILKFREFSSAMIIVHNFDSPLRPNLGILDNKQGIGQLEAIDRLNQLLCEFGKELTGIHVLDYKHLISLYGKLNWYDERMWMLAKAPISGKCLPYLADEYIRYLKPLRGVNRKCIVLDLDNTLWGGIVGEDGFNGIKIGHSYPGNAFREFQNELFKLYQRGILLAINSKNNFEDAIEVFRNHPDMILREEHFVIMKINWQNKAQNMKEIASELNIALDSIIFIDDSPVETEMIRKELPEVLTVELPKDPANYAAILQQMTDLESLSFSPEDRKRTEMYRSQTQRKQLQESSLSLEDFYRSLRMEAIIGYADDYTIPRISQLTQRTNQFNLTTRRYTKSDILNFSKSSLYDIFYLQLKDKFGDSGIVAVAITDKRGSVWEIDTFLMSCRVIGRTVENAFLAFIVEKARQEGAKYAIGTYIPTKKNGLVKDFYGQHGFELIEEKEGITKWRVDVDNSNLEGPEWIKITEIEEALRKN